MSDPAGWNAWGPIGPPPARGRRLPPVTFGGILEITGRLTRRHAGRLVILATLFLLPAWLLSAAAGVQLVTTVLDLLPVPIPGRPIPQPVTFTPEESGRVAQALIILLATSLLLGLAGAVAAAAFSDVVQRDYRGLEPSVRQAALRALRRLPRILGTAVLGTLAFVGLLLGGVMMAVLLATLGGVDPSGGGLGVFLALVALVAFVLAAMVLSVRWSLAIVVVALEERGPLAALIRSWRLTAGAAWRTLGILLLVTLVVAVIGGLLSEILGLTVADLLFGESSSSALVVRTIFSAIISVLLAPLLPVAMTVLYFDQRVRHEAFDLTDEQREP
ncbi:MAG: glycerophosphoryl diester phosphodiesterase membrane domain-containing protein [Chloroflexi bacterium]|nr:glycerophosphoryl diester phosphodiesterase membrane domain-containing protein [Chloroflexota bacterium]